MPHRFVMGSSHLLLKETEKYIVIGMNLTLNALDVGMNATVKDLRCCETMRRRLFDIGLIEGTSVKCLQKSPCGDPVAYLIRGAVIALRKEDTSRIIIG